jgi:hypothetical protein
MSMIKWLKKILTFFGYQQPMWAGHYASQQAVADMWPFHPMCNDQWLLSYDPLYTEPLMDLEEIKHDIIMHPDTLDEVLPLLQEKFNLSELGIMFYTSEAVPKGKAWPIRRPVKVSLEKHFNLGRVSIMTVDDDDEKKYNSARRWKNATLFMLCLCLVMTVIVLIAKIGSL